VSCKSVGGLAQAKRLQASPQSNWLALGCLELTFLDVLFETMRYMLSFRCGSHGALPRDASRRDGRPEIEPSVAAPWIVMNS
jgi:hypothetical protein